MEQDDALRVVCATWNVNQIDPYGFDSSSLNEWICSIDQAPDLFAICLQEIVELSDPGNYIIKGPSEVKMGHWTSLLYESVKSHYKNYHFRVLEAHHMVGTMVCIIVQSHLVQKIAHLKTRAFPLGRGRLGNKAAVVVRFDLTTNRVEHKSFCFVGVHLTAQANNLSKRKEDLKRIFRSDMEVLEHDMVFMFGDLNFRVNASWQDAIQTVAKGEIGELMRKDQLLLLMSNPRNKLLAGFDEGVVDFKPTFKYIPDSNEFDVGSKGRKKVRVPSWCDRVIMRTNEEPYKQLKYASLQSMNSSDHKPVMAAYEFPNLHVAFELARKLSTATESDFYIITSSSQQEGQSVSQCVSANNAYKSTMPEELSYEAGDIIDLIPEEILFSDGWLLGRLRRNGEIGYFDGGNGNVDLIGVAQVEFTEADFSIALKMSAIRHHSFHLLALKRKKKKSSVIPSTIMRLKSNLKRSPSGTESVASTVVDTRQERAQLSATKDRKASLLHQRINKFLIGKRKADEVYARALKGYSAKEEDELSFECGDVMLVVSRRSPSSSWWYAKNVVSLEEGLVPSENFPLAMNGL